MQINWLVSIWWEHWPLKGERRYQIVEVWCNANFAMDILMRILSNFQLFSKKTLTCVYSECELRHGRLIRILCNFQIFSKKTLACVYSECESRHGWFNANFMQFSDIFQENFDLCMPRANRSQIFFIIAEKSQGNTRGEVFLTLILWKFRE